MPKMTILGEGKTGGGFPWEFSFFLSPMKGGSLLLGTSAGSLGQVENLSFSPHPTSFLKEKRNILSESF